MAGSPYLGIEAGATRTRGVLAGPGEAAIARREAGAANVHAVGTEAARDAVAEVANGLLADAGIGWQHVRAAAFCLAGLRRQADREAWQRLVADIGVGCPLLLTHDAAAGLAAGSAEGTGILAICGTGSLVYGRRADGAEHTVLGRGPLLGDEGSGFDIGHQALRAAARALDGRGEQTDLARRICALAGVEELDDLLPWLSPFAKDRVAALAPAVFAAAAEGDAVAQGIVGNAAAALARGVAAVAKRLWPAGGVPRVVLGGGVLLSQGELREALRARVAPDTACTRPEVDGAVGAARLARRWHAGEA